MLNSQCSHSHLPIFSRTHLRILCAFRPLTTNFFFEHFLADGCRSTFLYPGFRFAPPGATNISPLCGSASVFQFIFRFNQLSNQLIGTSTNQHIFSPSHLQSLAPSVRYLPITSFNIRSRTVRSLHSCTRGVAPASLYPGLFTFNPFRGIASS